MKRVLIVLTLLMVLLFSICADPTEKKIANNSKELVLRGFIKKYCIVNVFPILAEGSGSIGFPFDLLGNDVAYSTDPLQGRVIATWIIATNYQTRTLQISATDLVNGNSSIGYYLKFRLSYAGENSDGSFSTRTEFITVHSGEDTTFNLENISHMTGLNTPLISTEENQYVLFMLDETSNANKNNDALVPDGTYNATVTFLLEGI